MANVVDRCCTYTAIYIARSIIDSAGHQIVFAFRSMNNHIVVAAIDSVLIQNSQIRIIYATRVYIYTDTPAWT